MARTKRIVCYAINGSGLGHVTRLLAISRWMRRFVTWIDGKAPEILFLSSSEAPQITHDAGFPTFKLPSKTVARQSGIDMLEYRRLAKHFVWNTLGTFNPDLLVVDTFPSGSFDELFQILDGPFKKGLVLREVKSTYAERPTFRAALRLYDTIVVPADQAAVDRMQLPSTLRPRPVGKVLQMDRGELIARQAARAQLGVDEGTPLIYLSAGGGGDPTTESTLKTLIQTLLEQTDAHVLVGAGPLYRGPRYPDSTGRVIWWTAPGLAKLMGAFDAAVSAAGYNSFHELMLARVPTVFYAQEKVADDQARRIDAAVAQGAALRADSNAPESILSAVSELLERPAEIAENCPKVVGENHARHAAMALLEPLFGASELRAAEQLLTPEFVHALEPELEATSALSTFYGKLLPALIPAEQRDSLTCGPSPVGEVLSQLSDSARKEVEDILGSRQDESPRNVIHQWLPKLIHQSHSAGLDLDGLTRLLEASRSKHPLTQEAHPDTASWLGAVFEGISGLLAGSEKAAENALLYRYWPKIVDADTSTSFRLLGRYLERRQAEGKSPWELQQELGGWKATHRKMTREIMETLLT